MSTIVVTPRAFAAKEAIRDTSFILNYPAEDFRSRLKHAIETLKPELPEASLLLERFEAGIQDMDTGKLEEIYTSTFDLLAVCDLHVSAHIFGEESYKRGLIMTGLAELYSKANFDRGNELPDAFPVILRFAPQFSDSEWLEFVHCCLIVATDKMLKSLERGENPYLQALLAIRNLILISCEEEEHIHV